MALSSNAEPSDPSVSRIVGLCLQGDATTRTISAKGMYVMPGGIDPHTHLDAPMMGTISIDDFAR